jgi:hypothetical protein
MMQVKWCLINRCELYSIEITSEDNDPSLDQFLLLPKLVDIFPNELPKLPLERDMEFSTELKYSMNLTCKIPYKRTTPKSCEMLL